METKSIQIINKQTKPIVIGDAVDVSIPFTKTEIVGKGKSKQSVESVDYKNIKYCTVVDVLPNDIFIINNGDSWSPPSNQVNPITSIEKCEKTIPYQYSFVRGAWIKQNISECGSNPFAINVPRVNFYNKSIESILMNCEYTDINNVFSISRRVIKNETKFNGKTYGGVNFDPTVVDVNGVTQHYQRGLVWTLEQKQQLINSIYLQVEIGKIVFRKKSWSDIEKQMETTGHGYDYDCCDGKQRIHAIIEFVTNKFPDFHGNYFCDLSERAQNRLLRYDYLSYGELDEGTSDKQVIRTFLNLNFAGTPIAEEHTNFVQSIKI